MSDDNCSRKSDEKYIKIEGDENINVLMPLMIMKSEEHGSMKSEEHCSISSDDLKSENSDENCSMKSEKEFIINSEDEFVSINIRHTNWVNANYKRLSLELLNNIRNKNGSGMFVVHKFNVNNVYNSYWTNKEKFKKMRLAEKEKNMIVELLERMDQTSIIVLFCDEYCSISSNEHCSISSNEHCSITSNVNTKNENNIMTLYKI